MNAGQTMLVVAAAMIDADGLVLVQQRPAGKPMSGLWEFPGGKVERDESPEAALVRELAEELAIGVASVDLVPLAFASEAGRSRHLVLLLYACRCWRNRPRALHADALRWATMPELRELTMPPADAPLLDALELYLRR